MVRQHAVRLWSIWHVSGRLVYCLSRLLHIIDERMVSALSAKHLCLLLKLHLSCCIIAISRLTSIIWHYFSQMSQTSRQCLSAYILPVRQVTSLAHNVAIV